MNLKLTSLSFFLILLAPVASTYCWLQHQKSVVKKDIKRKMIAGIDRDELVILKFSKTDAKNKLNWKHAKEFQYNKEMYDIVEKQVQGDSITYWCWWDHKETNLNRKLTALASGLWENLPYQKEKQECLFSFLKKPFFVQDFNWSLPVAGIQHHYSFHYLLGSSVYQPRPVAPPPRLS